jgi:hypothetical protein
MNAVEPDLDGLRHDVGPAPARDFELNLPDVTLDQCHGLVEKVEGRLAQLEPLQAYVPVVHVGAEAVPRQTVLLDVLAEEAVQQPQDPAFEHGCSLSSKSNVKNLPKKPPTQS